MTPDIVKPVPNRPAVLIRRLRGQGNVNCGIPSACTSTTIICLLQYVPDYLYLVLTREILRSCGHSSICLMRRSAGGQALGDFVVPVRQSEAVYYH